MDKSHSVIELGRKGVCKYTCVMPNPKMPHPPSTDHFMLSRGWRVLVRYQNGDGYSAQLERESDGQWRATGPRAHSHRSRAVVLSRLANGLRRLADLIDYGLALRPNLELGEGCPSCRYPHVDMKAGVDGGRWNCPACNASGAIPDPSQRVSPDHTARVNDTD